MPAGFLKTYILFINPNASICKYFSRILYRTDKLCRNGVFEFKLIPYFQVIKNMQACVYIVVMKNSRIFLIFVSLKFCYLAVEFAIYLIGNVVAFLICFCQSHLVPIITFTATF